MDSDINRKLEYIFEKNGKEFYLYQDRLLGSGAFGEVYEGFYKI